MNSKHFFLLVGSILGFLAVFAGAFGAHFLKNRLSVNDLTIFETAVRYQMYHAITLLFIGVLARYLITPWLAGAGWAFFIGTCIFSGSLYLLVFTGIRTFGMITPLGGLLLLIGWFCLITAAIIYK